MNDYTEAREALAKVLMSDRVMKSDAMGRDYALVEAYAVLAWIQEQGYVQPDPNELREARAETWDEAIETVFAWWSTPRDERPSIVVNPYGIKPWEVTQDDR